MEYVAALAAKVILLGFAILLFFFDISDMVYPLLRFSRTLRDKYLEPFCDVGLERWFNFKLKPFWGERVLCMKSALTFWAPKVNYGDKTMNKPDGAEGNGMFVDVVSLLCFVIEADGERRPYGIF